MTGRTAENLGPFEPVVEAIVERVVERLRPLLGVRPDDFVNRKSCRYSKRWWDRNADRTFPTFVDGRRKVAKAADVNRAFERQQKVEPKSAEPIDEVEADLIRAGIRLVGGTR